MSEPQEREVQSNRNDYERPTHTLTYSKTFIPREVMLKALRELGHDCPEHEDLTWSLVPHGKDFVVTSSLRVEKSKEQQAKEKRLADLEAEKAARKAEAEAKAKAKAEAKDESKPQE